MPEETTPHILVVDDDTRLRALLRKYLMDHGFRVTVAANAQDARQQLLSLAFDLIVLDRMMPGEDGLSLTRSLRDDRDVPILMLTAMAEISARIDGLEAGVDDYLPKPFEPRELLLRIRMILRRTSGAIQTEAAETAEKTIRLGEFEFQASREVLVGAAGPVRLTSAEASLLRVLAENAGQILSRDDLSRMCDINGAERTIDVQVTRLRRKIEPDPRLPRYLQTIRGRGYVLRPDD
jgi:two-component system, OmpR family, phosphate regulon response regulator OmpR